ncbi:MAG: membrane integrity-associated transporter subunit PqiC [Bradymonadales bacterium]|nr:MAG: membrane integrity-associated transporter subunit PqiC [Bradymonadales bacterium]
MKAPFVLFVLGCLFMMTGCASQKRLESTRFHSLPGSDLQIQNPGKPALVVGIGPVSVPRHLDRPHFVRENARGQLEIFDIHRWSQPLRQQIRYALALELQQQFAKTAVIFHPWYRSQEVDIQVIIEVTEFLSSDTEGVILSGQKTLRPLKTGREAEAQAFRFHRAHDSRLVEDQIEKMREVLQDLVQQVSKEVLREYSPPLVGERPVSAHQN